MAGNYHVPHNYFKKFHLNCFTDIGPIKGTFLNLNGHHVHVTRHKVLII